MYGLLEAEGSVCVCVGGGGGGMSQEQQQHFSYVCNTTVCTIQ